MNADILFVSYYPKINIYLLEFSDTLKILEIKNAKYEDSFSTAHCYLNRVFIFKKIAFFNLIFIKNVFSLSLYLHSLS